MGKAKHFQDLLIKLQEEPPVKNQKRDDFLHLLICIVCLFNVYG